MNEGINQIVELSARIVQLEKDKQELNQRLAERTNAFLQSEARHIQNLRDAQDAINKALFFETLSASKKAGMRILLKYKQRSGDFQ